MTEVELETIKAAYIAHLDRVYAGTDRLIDPGQFIADWVVRKLSDNWTNRVLATQGYVLA